MALARHLRAAAQADGCRLMHIDEQLSEDKEGHFEEDWRGFAGGPLRAAWGGGVVTRTRCDCELHLVTSRDQALRATRSGFASRLPLPPDHGHLRLVSTECAPSPYYLAMKFFIDDLPVSTTLMHRV